MFTRFLGTAFASGLTATAAIAEFPELEIQDIIQWGAGGSTDTVMRSVTPHAEAALGGSILMQNVTGGVGAIPLNQVSTAKVDGYTLLMGAENPLLYKVMGFGKKIILTSHQSCNLVAVSPFWVQALMRRLTHSPRCWPKLLQIPMNFGSVLIVRGACR